MASAMSTAVWPQLAGARPPSAGESTAPAKPRVLELLVPHLAALDHFLRSQLTAFEPEIRPLADYCIDASGKRLRPALVFLAGWPGDGAVPPDQVRAAAVVELVHLATLVHDDIMDEAEVRRGRRTAVRKFGSSAAVLLGDALFAHALNLAANFPTTEICAAVSASTRRVCAGEIVQTLRRGSTAVTLAEYRRIIELKTAELFRVSCVLGASLAGFSPDYTEAVGEFGRHLGIAFQIYDDLADFFGEEERIGKTLGTDLLSGKLTLPLFILLERLPAEERADLTEEIGARRAPQLALRLRQMREFGVFPAVAQAVEEELAAACSCLRDYPEPASSGLLIALAEVLRGQLGGLRPPSAN
jgi:octaprenyl-diphosphate synthase